MEGINYPSEKDYWKKIEKNDAITVINVLYVKKKEEKIYPAYISKHYSKCEKQVIYSRMHDKEKWHYLAITRLPALLRRIE